MRIDIHGHYTTAPPQLDAFRGRQVTDINKPRKRPVKISDDEITQSLQPNFAAMDDRKIDLVVFSPRASGMGHDFGDVLTSRYWTEVNNDLISRVCAMFPRRFAPACQLPQSPLAAPAQWLPELERCVTQLGFIGCNINPDISGGLQPFTPSLADRYWYPLWEKMVELDVPGMIHASSTHNPAFHLNGSHYIAWDYGATIELAASRVFDDFPTLKLIIPHGGGGVPYQFNRHRALHVAQKDRPFEEAIRQLYFDTSLYDQDSLQMLTRKVGPANILYGTEMFGTAKGTDPLTGRGFDDVGWMIEQDEQLGEAEREAIFSANALAVFPRLKEWLEAGQ
jgi:4-oxalmesaconate hydratase